MPRRFEDEGWELHPAANIFEYNQYGDLVPSGTYWAVLKEKTQHVPWRSEARIRRFWEINGRWPTEEDKE